MSKCTPRDIYSGDIRNLRVELMPRSHCSAFVQNAGENVRFAKARHRVDVSKNGGL